MLKEGTHFSEKQLKAISRSINEIDSSVEDPAFREILLNTYKDHFDLDYCHLANPSEDWSRFIVHQHMGDDGFIKIYRQFEEYCIFKSPLLRELPTTITLHLDLDKLEILKKTNPLFNALTRQYKGFEVISGLHSDMNGLIGIKFEKTSFKTDKLNEHEVLSPHFINAYNLHNKLLKYQDLNNFFSSLINERSKEPFALCDQNFKIITASDSFYVMLYNNVDKWDDIIPQLIKLYNPGLNCRMCSVNDTQFIINAAGDAINIGPVTVEKRIFFRITFQQKTGAPAITPREREIHRLICQGYSNKRIAEKLGISAETVKRHISNIFQKTGTSNRTELSHYML